MLTARRCRMSVAVATHCVRQIPSAAEAEDARKHCASEDAYRVCKPLVPGRSLLTKSWGSPECSGANARAIRDCCSEGVAAGVPGAICTSSPLSRFTERLVGSPGRPRGVVGEKLDRSSTSRLPTYFDSVTGSFEEVLIRLMQSATSPLAS
jgi:hypothetical protein